MKYYSFLTENLGCKKHPIKSIINGLKKGNRKVRKEKLLKHAKNLKDKVADTIDGYEWHAKRYGLTKDQRNKRISYYNLYGKTLNTIKKYK